MTKGNKPVFNARAKRDPANDCMQTMGAARTFKEGEGCVVRSNSLSVLLLRGRLETVKRVDGRVQM